MTEDLFLSSTFISNSTFQIKWIIGIIKAFLSFALFKLRGHTYNVGQVI